MSSRYSSPPPVSFPMDSSSIEGTYPTADDEEENEEEKRPKRPEQSKRKRSSTTALAIIDNYDRVLQTLEPLTPATPGPFKSSAIKKPGASQAPQATPKPKSIFGTDIQKQKPGRSTGPGNFPRRSTAVYNGAAPAIQAPLPAPVSQASLGGPGSEESKNQTNLLEMAKKNLEFQDAISNMNGGAYALARAEATLAERPPFKERKLEANRGLTWIPPDNLEATQDDQIEMADQPALPDQWDYISKLEEEYPSIEPRKIPRQRPAFLSELSIHTQFDYFTWEFTNYRLDYIHLHRRYRYFLYDYQRFSYEFQWIQEKIKENSDLYKEIQIEQKNIMEEYGKFIENEVNKKKNQSNPGRR